MATILGPDIPTDNLSLFIDITNTNSYPSGSTTLYDLSPSRITFSSGGTLMPLDLIDGVRCLNFNNSGYWTSDDGTSKSDLVDMGGDCTLVMWIYYEAITERDTIFEKAGTSHNSYQQEIAVTWETSEAFSYYSRNSLYDYANITSQATGEWHQASLKMSTGRTVTARTGFRSIEGGAWSSNYTSRSNTALVSAGDIKIGTGYAGVVETGSLGIVACYNKMLSDSEIAQFYSETALRFGK